MSKKRPREEEDEQKVAEGGGGRALRISFKVPYMYNCISQVHLQVY